MVLNEMDFAPMDGNPKGQYGGLRAAVLVCANGWNWLVVASQEGRISGGSLYPGNDRLVQVENRCSRATT